MGGFLEFGEIACEDHAGDFVARAFVVVGWGGGETIVVAAFFLFLFVECLL